ncbi:hypothetical protein HM1_2118 [Heliomicrobium modesticaldum Ice1]|uniref:Uncharacterized protein n=1 Tax=Heliobacterium modesticaldum (strain ATCC 51547 / Ice1) TaxID=498761 RepID=B0TGR4_HELMI|nr:hypothetical protein HM1_2118 [Heliomicrobium modesticaldum Ice1]
MWYKRFRKSASVVEIPTTDCKVLLRSTEKPVTAKIGNSQE